MTPKRKAVTAVIAIILVIAMIGPMALAGLSR